MGLVYFGIGPSSKVSTTSLGPRKRSFLLVLGEAAVQRPGLGIDLDDARDAEGAFWIGARLIGECRREERHTPGGQRHGNGKTADHNSPRLVLRPLLNQKFTRPLTA